MPTKANGISRADLYRELGAINDKLDRWRSEDAKRWETVAGTVGRLDATIGAQGKALDKHSDAIVYLERRDQKVGVIASAIGAVAAAIAWAAGR